MKKKHTKELEKELLRLHEKDSELEEAVIKIAKKVKL